MKKNLNLSARDEETIEKFRTDVVRFELNQIKQHFDESIITIKGQFNVADELIGLNKKIEAENIWRAQIIFLASALDFYMHEITKYGLCEIYDENWERTDKYNNLQVNMKSIEIALKSGEELDWFLEYVNSHYREVTMLSHESVKKQFNLLGIDLNGVANRAFHKQGETEKTQEKLKRRLNELFERRNIIAHQADRTHTDAQIKEITKEIVTDFIADIEKIVNSIDEEIRNK